MDRSWRGRGRGRSPTVPARHREVRCGRGLYVHIPFCSVKCFYCDFTAFSGQGAKTGLYLRALRRECALGPEVAVDTLYIGGGTPSELSAAEIEALLGLIASRFGPIERLRESTFEANPESAAPEKLGELRRHGVTRLSLGLETASPRLLKEIGRRHTPDQFLSAFSEAKRLGFSLSVDLMTGLPTQTLEEAVSSLETVLRLGPEHVSVYALRVEDRTLFARRGVAVDEALEREMYESCLERLGLAGYRHYEISNFALPGHESVHNVNYWRNGDYIGLGCGASGFLDGVRYENHDRLHDYCKAVEQGRLPAARQERLEGKRRLGETALLGLRMMEGLALTPEMRSAFAAELRHLEGQGWIEIHGGRARLTRDGLFFANKAFEEFVEPFRSDESCLPARNR